MTHRLFTGIALPPAVCRRLQAVQAAGTDSGLQWQQPRNLHLTLNFIGSVEADHLAALTGALAAVQCPPFSLQLSGVGFFGPQNKPRILWAGVADSEPLQNLQQQTLAALQGAGFRPDDSPYHPHVTLARCKHQPVPAALAWLEAQAGFRSPDFQIDQFCLFESTRDESGLVYRVVEGFRLPSDR